MENEKWMTIFHFPFALENENNGMYTDQPTKHRSYC